MTLYDKIMESEKFLVDLIVDSSYWNEGIEYNSCVFCSYNPLICDDLDLPDVYKDGFLDYYDNHKHLFHKDLITIDKIIRIIKGGRYYTIFLDFSSIDYVHGHDLEVLLNSEYSGKIKEFFEPYLDGTNGYYYL